MGTLANREDPDEMPYNAAFHLGLHCLLGQNWFSEKELKYNIFLENINCDPSMYTMNYSKFIVCRFMEHSIDLKKVRKGFNSLTF